MAYVGNIPAEAYISLSSQTFTTINGTGYTLSSEVTNSEDIALFLNDVRQQPSTYTATGTTLTMGTATTTADAMYCVYLGKGIQTVNPPAASVNTAEIADGAVTNAKVDASAAVAYSKLNLTDSIVNADINSSAAIATSKITGLAASATTDTTDASNIASGTLPDGRFPATLPTANGSNLTDLNATNLATGTVGTNRLASTGTASSSTFLRGDQAWAAIVGGLTEADSWRLTTDFAGNASPIASNWERSDTAGQGNMGTGMTESSGIFTFPSTGWWLIIFQAGFKLASDTSKYNGGYIVGTTNNSTYANLAGQDNDLGNVGGTSYAATCVATLFDVTDTTQCKVRFDIGVQTTTTQTCGTSTYDLTSAKFIKLGDT